MPKDTPIRWENAELIKILSYINNNIDMWCTNHLNACLKAIEATNNNKRDAKAVYNKIHSLIKAMDEFLKTGKKAQTCSIIWEETKIHDLVRKIYVKTKDRKKKDDNKEKKKKDDNLERRSKEGSQESKTRDDDGDVEMSNSSDQLTPTNRSTVNGPVSQLPFSPDLIEKLYNEKCQQIAELRTKLTKTAESAKSVFDMANAPIPFQLDSVETTCNDKHFNNFELDNKIFRTRW
ncbi:unnamed protein product [Rhizophagus irregularis]|nr:unnamed protein product [Rhizophagus irregularis]CAB5389462.1 unnamed protein product [Rhizophagus irregularis]